MTARPCWSDLAGGVLALCCGLLAWWQIAVTQHPFSLDDWLISYAGGPVRRGLGGSAVMALAGLTRAPPQLLVLGVVLLVQGVFLWAAVRLLRRVRAVPQVWLLVASPAVFLFPTFDPGGAFRKEILLFAVLAVCLDRALRGRAAVPVFAVAAPVIVLLHEGMAAFLPWGLALLAFGDPGRAGWRWIGGSQVAVCAALAFAWAFPGDAGHVQAICAGLARWPELVRAGDCAGVSAIGWLANGRVPPGNADPTLLPWIGPAVALTLAGMAPATLRLRGGAALRIGWIGVAAGGAVAASLPLFAVAVDWGRFVHVHATCLTLVLLAATARCPPPRRSRAASAAFVLLAAVQASTWHLQHYRTPMVFESGFVRWVEFGHRLAAYEFR